MLTGLKFLIGRSIDPNTNLLIADWICLHKSTSYPFNKLKHQMNFAFFAVNRLLNWSPSTIIDSCGLGVLGTSLDPDEYIMPWLLFGSTQNPNKRHKQRSVTQIRVYFRRLTLVLHLLSLIFLSSFLMQASGQNSKDSSRLYETLLSDYNKLVRPVLNNTDKLVVKFKLKLSQLLDVVSFSKIYGKPIFEGITIFFFKLWF